MVLAVSHLILEAGVLAPSGLQQTEQLLPIHRIEAMVLMVSHLILEAGVRPLGLQKTEQLLPAEYSGLKLWEN